MFKLLYKRNVSIVLFVGFLVLNLYYFTSNFFLFFLNEGNNADEYYENNLYSITTISIEKIFYSQAQPYIFISSCFNSILNTPKIATRLVSLVVCLMLIFYFLKKINSAKCDLLEKIYKSTLFVCAIFITNQMYIGTSDFLSFVFIVPAFLIILESIAFGKINLTIKQSCVVGMLFALSLATRPTAIVLIVAFYLSFILIIGLKKMFCKENYIIGISCLFFFFVINFLPIIEQNRVVLDVKEVPKETGVTWFQINYLMAKNVDSKKTSSIKWLTVQEVIDFKKANPNFVFPKNQIDLLLKEPGLYFRQMIRMFVKSSYSSYRFMYLLFPILFLSFLKKGKIKNCLILNYASEREDFQNKIVVIFYVLSILFFSFLAVKMMEYRWVIPVLILYAYFSLSYLSKFTEKARFLIYNLSFISGIVMYVMFFIKT
ncbi:MAG TPA: hypothetical protein VIV55_05155 [Flavobacterium sp.]